MKIEVEVSEKNEGTSFPYWLILDPVRNLDLDVGTLASMITGPFFSRKEAESALAGRRYNYSKRAVVYCKSGCDSESYRKAMCDAAIKDIQPPSKVHSFSEAVVVEGKEYKIGQWWFDTTGDDCWKFPITDEKGKSFMADCAAIGAREPTLGEIREAALAHIAHRKKVGTIA